MEFLHTCRYMESHLKTEVYIASLSLILIPIDLSFNLLWDLFQLFFCPFLPVTIFVQSQQ